MSSTLSTLSVEERQQRLNEASEQYMNDGLSDEAFEQAKSRYTADYRSAILALARNLETTEQEDKAPAYTALAEITTFLLAILGSILFLLWQGKSKKRQA